MKKISNEQYNIKTDKRVAEVLQHPLAEKWGWHFVVLKKRQRESSNYPLAFIDSEGKIVANFQDLFPEGFNGHDLMNEFLIPITYSRYQSEQHHNMQPVQSTPSDDEPYFADHKYMPSYSNSDSIDLMYKRCNYIDEFGNVFSDNIFANEERFFIYSLINCDLKDLATVVSKMKAGLGSSTTEKKELSKFHTYYKIIDARIRENPKALLSEIAPIIEAYNNRMDELESKLESISNDLKRRESEVPEPPMSYGVHK